jgi:hypothetical protein
MIVARTYQTGQMMHVLEHTVGLNEYWNRGHVVYTHIKVYITLRYMYSSLYVYT